MVPGLQEIGAAFGGPLPAALAAHIPAQRSTRYVTTALVPK